MSGKLGAYGGEVDYSVLEDTHNYDDGSGITGGSGSDVLQEVSLVDVSNLSGDKQGAITVLASKYTLMGGTFEDNFNSVAKDYLAGDSATVEQVNEYASGTTFASMVNGGSVSSSLFDGVIKASAPAFTTAIGTALNRMVSGWFGGTPNVANRPPAPTGYHYDTTGRLINNTTGQPLVGSAVASSGMTMQKMLLYGVGAFVGYKVLKATKVL
jgi:hypothetical protein